VDGETGVAEPPLVGRATEQERIARMLEAAERAGDALVICGPPGIGKTALLDWAADAGGDRVRVLRATGFTAELGHPYAGLHQVLRPLLSRAASLSPRRRGALEAAFGLAAGPAPDLYAVAMSALELLADAGVEKPLLVLVDDVQWIDPASQQALAFLARRTAAERIVLLATQRVTEPGPMLDRAFPVVDLAPLDGPAAVEVLDRGARALDARTRARILEVAQGNPLALRELPRTTTTTAAGQDVSVLPLTARLEHSFTTRLDDLDTPTRTALEVAAANDSDDLAEVVAATELLLGPVPSDVLGPAVFVGLADVENHAVRFSHPLVRSSIYQRLAPEARRSRHAALARVLSAEPERAVRHRAAAALHPDAVLASALEHAADRALERGATSEAVSALDRAAQLSPEAGARRHRLFRAAGLAYEVGASGHGDRLRARYRELVHDEHDRVRFEWLGELAATDHAGEHRVDVLLASADRAHAVGDDALALRFLRASALRCWNFCPDRPVGRTVIAAADRLPETEPSDRAALLAHGDPLGRAADVLLLLDRARSGPHDATTAYGLGHAAACVGAFDVSEDLFAEAVDRLRAEGRLHTLGTTLGLLSWSALRRGRWATAVSAADEAARLCAESDQPFWHVSALAAHGVVAALRGDLGAADGLVDEAERIAAPYRFVAANAVIVVARATSAAAAGDHDRAFAHLARLHDPFDPARHPMHGLWSLAAFADAALACGEEDAARKVLAELRPEVAATASPAGRMNLVHAAAVLATEDDAETRFRAAVRASSVTWPHEHHRLLLAFGSWLRRRHRVQESRGYLRAARDGFDDLGSGPWGARAREELRTTGEQSHTRERDVADELSPQEAQIAAMVAEGLSNREIGERLFLSHRTVGSHLYRMFPKLGVHSRVELVRLVAERGPRAP
jgi:DNA-binding CsgD family transcriptional regulator/tetratricopeptide (TPR) repeat protein